jgi:hypothetical protein
MSPHKEQSPAENVVDMLNVVFDYDLPSAATTKRHSWEMPELLNRPMHTLLRRPIDRSSFRRPHKVVHRHQETASSIVCVMTALVLASYSTTLSSTRCWTCRACRQHIGTAQRPGTTPTASPMTKPPGTTCMIVHVPPNSFGQVLVFTYAWGGLIMAGGRHTL